MEANRPPAFLADLAADLAVDHITYAAHLAEIQTLAGRSEGEVQAIVTTWATEHDLTMREAAAEIGIFLRVGGTLPRGY